MSVPTAGRTDSRPMGAQEPGTFVSPAPSRCSIHVFGLKEHTGSEAGAIFDRDVRKTRGDLYMCKTS